MLTLTKANHFQGKIRVPGDKSISHRAVMFGALSEGRTEVTNFLQGADCLSTIDCFRRMGIEIDNRPERITIHGKGLHGLKEPVSMLDTGNSGTTTRLISGILSGQSFTSTLSGDASICRRPMKRIMEPLSQMGADIVSLNNNGCTPLRISPSRLHGIHYTSPVASAQVKSAVLLAGLYADSITSVTEPAVSRNHTEIMLQGFGASVHCKNTTASIEPEPKLFGQQVSVPGDISSAAYFLAAGLLVPNAQVLVQNVGINPTRAGILEVIRQMGGHVEILNPRSAAGEPAADLLATGSSLHGIEIGGGIIPALIDELPVIAVLAAFAEGTTIIRDAAELKVKESDRIAVTTENLRAMGCDVTPTEDGMIIRGGKPLHGALIDPHLDHRIAMSFAVAALAAEGTTSILDEQCVSISYPAFFEDLKRLASSALY